MGFAEVAKSEKSLCLFCTDQSHLFTILIFRGKNAIDNFILNASTAKFREGGSSNVHLSKKKKTIAYFEAPLLKIFDFKKKFHISCMEKVIKSSFLPVRVLMKFCVESHWTPLDHYFNQKSLKSTTKIRLLSALLYVPIVKIDK